MIIQITCPACMKKGFFSSNLNNHPYREDGIYDFTCRNGHRQIGYDNSFKFESLYDIASNAILDGYYRDAIASYNASYERLNEFALKVIYLEKGFTEVLIQKYWKTVNSQSERQIGAFIFAYGIVTKSEPKSIDQKITELRNNVIHKGFIPTKDDSIRFGQYILSYCREIIENLRIQCKTGMEKARTEKAKISIVNQEDLELIFGFSSSKILSLADLSPNKPDLIEGLENIKLLRSIA